MRFNYSKFFVMGTFPFIVLLTVSTSEYFLLLRHKDPWVSDSYFYEHMMYEMKGLSFNEARTQIHTQLHSKNINPVEQNFYYKDSAYKNSLSFFKKRPLYSFLALIFFSITNNIYISFLIPACIGYLLSIMLVYSITSSNKRFFLGSLTTVFLTSFYPFLDLSTYFLTDAIGTAFWFALILLGYLYVETSKNRYLFSFLLALVISLFNREQTLLLSIHFLLLFVIAHLYHWKNNKIVLVRSITLLTVLVNVGYLLISYYTKQQTLLDTLSYTMNSYGLTNNIYTLREILTYLFHSIIYSHVAFFRDLVHYRWWLIILILSFIGVWRSFRKNKMDEMKMVILTSAIAAYFGIFLYPVLSYRYFIPTAAGICFFAAVFILDYFKYEK